MRDALALDVHRTPLYSLLFTHRAVDSEEEEEDVLLRRFL
jgi:hypothetical protein